MDGQQHTSAPRGGSKERTVKRRMTLPFFSAVLACSTYLVSATLSYARYPVPYSPLTHWLSDLGDRSANPDGAVYYNVGILTVAALLFIWFLGLSEWKVSTSRPQFSFLWIAQVSGALGALAVAMSAVFPIDMFQAHAFWSRAHYMMLAMGFGFSVAALACNPEFPRILLYVGTLASFSPLATLVAGDVYWMEWVSVGLFLLYVMSVGISSLRLTRRPPAN
jgi:hypothetical protein